MSAITLRTVRHMQRRLDARLGDLIDWEAFSLVAVKNVVAQQAGGVIGLYPLHWEAHAYFGLTLSFTVNGRPRWLVVYEREAAADHLLMIVLHELMHIALGHRSTLTHEVLARELAVLGLAGLPQDSIAHACACAVPESENSSPHDVAMEEAEAELAAAWIVTRARRAGSLSPAGQSFAPEHMAISCFLGGGDGH